MVYGLCLTFIIAFICSILEKFPFFPFTIFLENGNKIHILESMVLALIVGIILSPLLQKKINKKISNGFGTMQDNSLKKEFIKGINFSVKYLLPFAIILMGFRFNLNELLEISLNALIINLICVFVAFYLTIKICQKMFIQKDLSYLIAIGTAICGGSAIVAAAPVLKSKDSEIALAVTVISLFGLLAIFIFPLIGYFLHLSQEVFGVWVGTSIQAVPQVVASGFLYGVIAGKIAIVVKMIRVLLLAPLIIYLNIKLNKNKELNLKGKWYNFVPRFILLFLLIVILNSFGYLDFQKIFNLNFNFKENILFLSNFFMAMAMAGVGLNTNIQVFIKTGFKPLIAGFVASIIIAILSIILILLIF